MAEHKDQIFNLAFLYEFAEGDRELMLHFINKFLDNYPKEADAIEKALVLKDRKAVYLAAHSWRPQLEFVGLKDAASQLLEIEHGAREEMSFEQMHVIFQQVQDQLKHLPEAKEWIL